MATATMGTHIPGRWGVPKPDTHGAGWRRRRPLSADGDQHGDTGRGLRDGAAQVAAAARAAALAERRRLARDLHDSVTQTLISLHLTAQAAAELWDTQPQQARAALDTVRHLAAGAATEMRALLMDLHDTVLEQHGLVGALQVYCAVVQQRSGRQVELRGGAGHHAPRAGPL